MAVSMALCSFVVCGVPNADPHTYLSWAGVVRGGEEECKCSSGMASVVVGLI